MSTISNEYKEEAKKLMRISSVFEKVEDIEFTIYMRECFLSIKGNLNVGMKTKEGLYEKMVEIKKGVEEAWEEKRAGK